MDLLRHEHGLTGSAQQRFPRGDTLARHLLPRRSTPASRPGTSSPTQFPWCEPHTDAILDLFRAYVARKRAAVAAGLRRPAARLAGAAGRPGARRRRWPRRWDHVLVDEYQDVNQIQVDIVRLLRPDGAGLTVVGDDAQAVYGFRGADSRHLLDLSRRPAERAHRRAWSRTSGPGNGSSTWPTRSGRRRRRAAAARCAPTATAAPRPAAGPLPRRVGRGPPGRRRRARRGRAGPAAARPGRADARRAPQRPARGRADRAPGAVREVRRPEVPRGRPRQGLHRRACGCSTTRSTRSPGSGCCACTTASARPGPARCSTRSRPASPTPSCATPTPSRPHPAAARTALAGTLRRAGRAPGAQRHGRRPGRARARPAAPAADRPLPRPPRPGSATSTGWSARRRSSPTLADYVANLTLDPPASHQRPRRAAAPRRGLPRAVDRALGQGSGVGQRARHPRHRRRVPVRHGPVHRRPGWSRSSACSTSPPPGPATSSPSTRRCACRTIAAPATTGTATPRPAGSSTTRPWRPWTSTKNGGLFRQLVAPSAIRRGSLCRRSTNCGNDLGRTTEMPLLPPNTARLPRLDE